MEVSEAASVRPNQHVAPATMTRIPEGLRIGGYQVFDLLGPHPVAGRDDRKLRLKAALLAPYFSPRVMGNRTVLDVGGNAGFFGFWALAQGASEVTSIDVDPDYVELSNRAAEAQRIRGFQAIYATLPGRAEPADVTLAFAMIHWLYNCTTGWGSLEEVVAQLAARTRALLLVEWVAPSDSAIQFFGHLDRGPKSAQGPYTYALFEAALRKHFEVVELVGIVSPTRRLLAAWKARRMPRIDMSCPMPLLHGVETIISCSRIAVSGDGLEYWSRVYDLGDRICKQERVERIRHEATAMERLTGCDFAPRLLRVTEGPEWGHIEMEKVKGSAVLSAREGLRPRAVQFALDAVKELLEMRRRGVVHRDISADNMMVRDGRPVLLDFGWAQLDGVAGFTPSGLGGAYRDPEGTFSDAYSLGKVLSEVVGAVNTELDSVLSLMTHRESVLRVSDPEVLVQMLQRVAVEA